jgi:hypothetical protein
MPKLLILSSNPRQDLNLDREISDLNNALQRLGIFEISLGLGVPAQEISELIAQHSPEIVHFCGHGAGAKGLVFQDEEGKEQLVSTEILARIFKTFGSEINCTVLNACDTVPQAEAIVEYINYAIGMNQPILDKAAYHFSVGFYKGLGSEKSIDQAYEMGCIAIQIWSETNSQSTQSRQYRKFEYTGEIGQPAPPLLPEHQKPVLLKKAVNLVREVPTLLVSTDQPQEFVEFVKQEIDRQDYKDRARDAYDNFGQFLAQNKNNLTKIDYEQRKILLGKVKQFWIEGYLQPSINGVDAISFDMKAHPDVIANLTQGIEALSVELDASYERLKISPIYQEIGQGRTLLVLGSPGAGKTIALLQLAQRLIERTEKDLSLPIPIVLNLHSWSRSQKSIIDWLIDELLEKYQVPRSLSENWIQQQQLILLLDGLDEVNEEYRNDCVRVLNDFIELFPQTNVAICCRVGDYEKLTARLQIATALCLQPLTSEQVYQFLDKIGGSLSGLKTLLKTDTELEQFARTPLILTLMSVAYQGWSVEELITQLMVHPADRNRHLFDTYIDRRLAQGATSEYPKVRVLCWLSYLANQMQKDNRMIFSIEKMQPIWLQNRSEERIYRIGAFILTGLIFGLIPGVIAGLNAAIQVTNIISGLIFGLKFWLIAGLVAGLIAACRKKISPLERLSWSWRRAKASFASQFFAGFLSGLLGMLFFSWIVSTHSPIHSPIVKSVISGAIGGVSWGLLGGLGNDEIEPRTVPNQGIFRSLSNCFIVGLIGVLVYEIFLSLNSGSVMNLDNLVFALSAGMLFGLLFGGAACIQHFTLRQILYKQGRIPWNYAKLLDFASNRLLMKKIGGGYVFFHRMLLDHFAGMNLK